MVFYNLVLQFHFKECGSSHQRCSVKKGILNNFTKLTGKHLCQSLFLNIVANKKMILFWGKNRIKTKQYFHNDNCRWEIACIKTINKRTLKKMKNDRINMASDHSVSSNNSFKSHLNANSFNMFLTLQQLCEAR